MSGPQCDQLDDYLCGWLSSEDAAGFEAHLAACTACREECALGRRIDSLLAEGNAATAVPVGLISRIERGIQAARRRQRLGWAGVLAAAAGVVLALGFWAAERRPFSAHEKAELAQHPPAEERGPAAIVPPTAVQVTMVDPLSAIVMPVESHHANITIVRVFPTLRVDREGEVPKLP